MHACRLSPSRGETTKTLLHCTKQRELHNFPTTNARERRHWSSKRTRPPSLHMQRVAMRERVAQPRASREISGRVTVCERYPSRTRIKQDKFPASVRSVFWCEQVDVGGFFPLLSLLSIDIHFVASRFHRSPARLLPSSCRRTAGCAVQGRSGSANPAAARRCRQARTPGAETTFAHTRAAAWLRAWLP